MGKQEVTYVIFFGSLVFFMLGIFVVAFLFTYYRKNQAYHKKLLELEYRGRQELLKSRLEMQEQTLNAISQEIHDNVGQVLSLTKMKINIIEETILHSCTLLQEAKESLTTAITSLRDIAKSLSTERIVHFSLEESIQAEINRIEKTGVLQIQIVVEGKEKTMREGKKLILFRIIQECLQNIIKHSGAADSILLLHYEEDQLRIRILDGGKGFDVKEAMAAKTGLGLQNITNRATVLGGSALIVSKIAEGTTININIPYE
jgi:two-component system, NarL family, sensor kinase